MAEDHMRRHAEAADRLSAPGGYDQGGSISVDPDAVQQINVAPPPRIGGAFLVGLSDDPHAPIVVPVHNPATAEQITQIGLERDEAIALASQLLAAVMHVKPAGLRMW